MEIKNKDLRFERNNRVRSQTNKVIIHHSASHDVGVEEIHRWHLGRGWLGIGYHFVIRKDGTIERGREESTVGAHAGRTANSDSIGVCVTGRIDQTPPTKEQINSLAWLIADYLIPKYGQIEVKGHSDFMKTACPGKHFPWEQLRKKMEVKPMGKHFTDLDDDRWSASHINMLYEEGLIGGYKDGTFRPTETITREEVAVLIGRLFNRFMQ